MKTNTLYLGRSQSELLRLATYPEYDLDCIKAIFSLRSPQQESLAILYKLIKETYFKHETKGEKSFIFITTNFINGTVLDVINTELADDENLLICTKVFETGANKRYKNTTVQKHLIFC